jgi:hypothetical protein
MDSEKQGNKFREKIAFRSKKIPFDLGPCCTNIKSQSFLRFCRRFFGACKLTFLETFIDFSAVFSAVYRVNYAFDHRDKLY